MGMPSWMFATILATCLPASALADCGWVLWSQKLFAKVGESGPVLWGVQSAYEDRSGCMSEAIRIAKLTKELYEKEKHIESVALLKDEPGIIAFHKETKMPVTNTTEHYATQEKFVCLPSNTDPRPR